MCIWRWTRYQQTVALINNLSTNVLKQLSINNKGYPFFKDPCFKKTEFFMKLGPIRTNFESTISYGINHTKFVYCRQETFKMGVHTTKSRLPINSCYKFSFPPRYFYIKKCQLSIFFLFKGERYVWILSIKITMKFQELFSWFEGNKNVISMSSVKNWFKFLWALF